MSKRTANKVPQIRFKGFSGTWIEKNVSEICGETYGGGTPRTSERKFWEGETAWIQSSDIPEGEIYKVVPRKYISDLALRKSPTKLVPENSIAIVTRVGVGKLALIEFSYAASQDFLSLSKLKANPSFAVVALSILLQSKLHETQGTSIKGITKEELLAYSFNVPDTVSEQQKIGGYFREVDRLIGLHQRKHDKLVTLKKAMLQKMFPQPGTTTPEIRFKGFSGEWIEKKLGDSTTNVASNTLSRANLNYRSGLARNVHYGDILVQYKEVLDVQNNGIPFISDDAVATKLKSSNLANGDIVVADAAEDEMVGKCTEIQNVGDQIVLAGLHTIALRPLTNFAPFYLGYYLNSDAFHDQLLPIMQGTKVLSISKTAIKHTAICFPIDEAEQQKIGTYFRKLDELISKHTIQLQKLTQIKSACLEKMFV